MDDENMLERANEYIFEKLIMLFGITDETKEPYLAHFKSDEVKIELTKLYTSPQTVLVVGIQSTAGKEKFIMNPKDHKRKGILILKSNKEDKKLDQDMSKNFIFIELNRKILEEMYDICKDVFFPMLSQNVKNDNHSELISKELVEKFHNFLSHYYVCLGHMKGETRLPEPSEDVLSQSGINENERTQIYEGAVVMWIDLIRHIIKQEPEHEFRNGNNPLPLSEIEFWQRRDATLTSILEQIKKPSICKILEFLQKQKSTYFHMFNEIKRDVEQKAKEAKNNYTYLKVLETKFALLGDEGKELADVADDFIPIFHIIRKIWEDNKDYAKPERLIVLIRKICNSIIDKGTEYIRSNVLAKILEEPEKEIEQLNETRNYITQFMEAYFTYKDSGENGWHITRNVIFYRLDAFNDRLGDILNVAKSFFEFRKMSEKVLGGIKADALQLALKNIFDECTNAIKTFNAPIGEKQEEFNALDISNDLFNVRYSEFKDNLKELERKISAVLTQTFDENETILGKFKVLENFDTILERPYIAVELEKKYNILLDAYKNELKVVQNLFLTGKKLIDNNDPRNPLNKNMPPIAAKLNWTYSLKSRIAEPLEKFNKCGKRITEKEEFKEIQNSFDSISKMIEEYGNQSKIEWDEKAKVASIEKQKIFILTKSEGLINVNFDPELNQLLKEVKYLNILNMEIPEEAEQTYQKNNTFRRQISDLENIKSQYNTIIKLLNEVEKPMVAKKLQKVEQLLKDGFDKLTWEMNDDIDKFTKKALDSISELSATVDKLKTFVNKVNNIFIEYNKPERMLFQRPPVLQDAMGVKTKFAADFDGKRTEMANKVKDIASLQEVQNALKSAVPNLASFKETEEWKNYQHYINSIVLEGSINLIHTNLTNLSNCLDPSLEPFCSVRLLLEDRKIFFAPSFYSDGSGLSIKDMIIEWINSFLNLSTLFRVRVDTSSGDYMIEVLESCKVQEIVYKLYNEISELTKDSDERLNEFNDFKMIWESDFQESFQTFLKENTVIPEITEDQKERYERIQKVFNEKNPNPITKNIVEYTPSKEVFDDKINEFKDKLKRVKNMPNSISVRWIKVDFTEFKNSLNSSIESWIEQYKDFLRNNSRSKLENIDNFMKRVENGILNKPKDTTSPEDKKKFFQLLENIRDMELLFPKIIELIPSIQGELTVLNKHMKRENEDDPFDIEEKNIDSEEQQLLIKTAEIEKAVPELKKRVDNLSEEINELIDKEKTNFRENKKKFEDDLNAFRKEFLEKAPKKMIDFSAEEIKNAYESLDDYYQRTLKLEAIMKENNDMELLLKIPLSKNQQIADCYRDLKMIKSVWDYAQLNYDIFESWKKIKISDIDIRDLTDLAETLKSNLNNVKKDVRTTVPAYGTLAQITKDNNETMSQIQNLTEGNVIKTRHWRHLQEVIQQHIPFDSPDFSVNDFMELKIYKFKDEVEGEKAIAEGQGKMEKEFNAIDKRWQSEKFIMTNVLNKKIYDFYLFDHSKMDNTIENLEVDISKLMSQSQRKNLLENFDKMGDNIKAKLDQLKTVCDVTKQWLKLQKSWEKLEVIFLKSDDIQNKLRNEYTAFKELDLKFREEMKNAYDYLILVDVCTDQRLGIINEMLHSIEECQKALDNYLGTKKKQFPRFYFVSNDTLLGMLASADYPNLINKNVKDCFDGIKQWGMKEQDANGKSDTVYSMYSADNGEIVTFDEPFVCEGQLVEIYLGKFEEKMRQTLRDLLFKAHAAVNWNSATGTGDKMKDDKTRHTWLNPFPAQLALLVTQVIWTEEMEHALEATDSGDSGALKDFYELSVKRIEHLIDRVRDEKLTRDLRVKIITVITVDVHGRDVTENFSKFKQIDVGNFNWKKQLRFYYFPEKKQCDIRICDYITHYSYEYIGNTGRLVITPLTDRCYITLTQALNLILGGAPAGPAGTGKTETVKDLGRNMGLGVIVNNCSEQMDIETTGRIFSGLAQTGFWGCFDEFNRILIEVLSVVSSQVKIVLDALRGNLSTFSFEGNEIGLINTVGFFITMNPGYAGRTELPDNLKALFRSCAMVVPDLKEICQNMLMSEGFSKAKPIASKFITLYKLSRDLLSKQIHYDWGLRAIKSLLRQAGGLKRLEANKSKNEFTIIKTALFDFNKAKIVPDDLIIFERLLADLFKESEKSQGKEEDINQEINQKIDKATECKDVNLQKDAFFTIKTRQLKEILEVRHCLFILGAPGSGKTCVWKTLFYTNANYLNEESKYAELSPKAINGFELFGYTDDKTKVWKYGILSSIMKKMCKNEPPYSETNKNKWIILDGDIDPNWIESLNTVMDDNKVLTLTNGDRFPLDEYMRLLFEVSNLRNATPATVSRGGVLYINENDIGITPCFDKWIKDKYSSPEMAVVKRSLQEFFKSTFEKIRDWRGDKYIAPVVEISLLHNFMTIFQNMMDNVLYNKAKPFADIDDETKGLLAEGIFFFSFMWGCGGGLINRNEMHSVVNGSIKSKNKLRIPEKGNCFDYYFDTDKIQWIPWLEKLPKPVIEEKDLFSDIIIPNVEVTRLCRITEINMLEDRAVLFIGSSGTGKTAVVKYFFKNYMESLSKLKRTSDGDSAITFENCTINFNSFTDSLILQGSIDGNIKGRFSNHFGPDLQHKKIFFMDDLNMPQLDIFGTQSHVELLRQAIDYKFYYDRKELENTRILEDLLYIGSQNPTAGSFVIDSRLQRHFTLLSASEPTDNIIKEIYNFIMLEHFTPFVWRSKDDNKESIVNAILDQTCKLLATIRGDSKFNPSASKFHYQWNMREICRVVGGVLRSSPTFYKDSTMLFKLWYHECNRVFKDRLILDEDMKGFDGHIKTLLKEIYKADTTNLEEELAEPFIFVPFGAEITDEMPEALIQFKSYDALRNEINENLQRYNDEKGDLPLVLFDDAIQDICRIARIISNPCSNALLVGVGGSGKQSLSRLAAFIKEIEFAMPNLTGTDYGKEEFLLDIRKIMDKAVLKQGCTPYAFLVNDNHIIDEYFLVYINTFLSSYWIEELFETAKELEEAMTKNLRSTAPELGFTKSSNDYTVEGLKEYLIYRVKKNVHFVLCMSPVGDTLRTRARKFPSILSGSSIDWFHDWPEKALIAVSSRSVSEMEQFREDEAQTTKIAKISASIHQSINEFNASFFESERRYNYTTPKSFLELIKYFQLLVGRKMEEIDKEIQRLEQGLQVVAQATEKVKELQADIAVKSVEVEAEQKKTAEILERLEVENKKISKEKDIVETAAAKAAEESANAEKEKATAQAALDEALPAMQRAEEAATNINPDDLNKFKNPNKPSERNFQVFKLVYLIFNPKDKMPGDDIAKELPNIKNKALSKSAEQIKNQMIGLLKDITWITPEFLAKVQKYREPPYTDLKEMAKISGAVKGIMEFFLNMITFYEKFQIVKPLEEKAKEATETAEKAMKEKEELEERFKVVSKKQRELQAEFDESKAKKEAVEREQQNLMDQLAVAEKFIGLLADSNERWKQEVVRLKSERLNIAGDCILGSSFVSYIGVFNSFFRMKVIEKWKDIINSNEIKITDNIDLVRTLSNEAEILKMKAEGLPSDPFSEENAVIITQCTRYPLVIDPQMQAIAWLKNRSDKKTVVQYKQKNWDQIIGEALGTGDPLIIEDVDQEIDPLLSPIMGKQTTNKDKNSKMANIRVGSNDYPFNTTTPIYFITKISNPHYKPEIVAQCTLVNFIVTEKGLEDQLLALVVNIEKPDLEENIRNCVNTNNKLQAELLAKEDDVLKKLNEADPSTILQNTELINSLENTKNSSIEITKSKKETEDLIKEINEKREIYRGVGQEGAMLFFLIGKLFVINYMYQYSLNSFQYFFEKAIGDTEKTDNLQLRVQKLREKIRITVYVWISAGMFEVDKKLLLTLIGIRLLQRGALTHESLQGVGNKHIQFLLKCPGKPGTPNPFSGLIADNNWDSLVYLSDLDGLQGFAEKVEKEYSGKFKEWYNEIEPEQAPLPPEWKKYQKHSFHKILILRACRRERVGLALNEFIRVCLPEGENFLQPRTFSDNLHRSYFDSRPETPIFFILSPGSNPITDLEILGGQKLPKEIKKSFTHGKGFKYIAMGQNAEKRAEEELKNCNANGEWLFLQNIHLMPKWLKCLEDKLKELAKEKGHEDFRLYLSAEPSNKIPVGILEKCIKLTNEPPSGLKENMVIAFQSIKNAEGVSFQDEKRRCGIIFALSYYHSVLIERKKFGSLGWNRNYPFSLDDLRNSDAIVGRYIEPGVSRIPWEDLKYIVGEIMYGGHIVDDLDRVLNNAYLNYLLDDKLLVDLDLVPYPSNSTAMKVNPIRVPMENTMYPFEIWDKYIEEIITSESPALFGLHPNAEIEYRIAESSNLFKNMIDLEPKDSGGGESSGEGNAYSSAREFIDRNLEDIKEGLFDISKIKQLIEGEVQPEQNVFIQECEYMNNLCTLIIKNLKDISDALKGSLSMDERIEGLIFSLFNQRVPPNWITKGFSSKYGLTDWKKSLDKRIEQLKAFEGSDGAVPPKVVFINRLFNPLSYLTAIRQLSARKQNQELDKLDIQTEPSQYYLNENPDPNSLNLPESRGIPVYGMHLQGCSFDRDSRCLAEAIPKKTYFILPIIYCKVVPIEQLDPKKEMKNSYFCPIYKTLDRQSTFVCFSQFKSKEPPAKWTIAGVAVILECVETDGIAILKFGK